MLADAELPADDATVARLLVATQPMRATIRASGDKQRGALLRGVSMTGARGRAVPGPSALPGRAGPGGPLEPVAQVSLIKRLFVLLVAVWVSVLAMISMMAPMRWLTVLLAAFAVALVWAAITGRGLSAPRTRNRTVGALKTVVGGYALLQIGGPVLLGGIAVIVTPSAWRDGGLVERMLAGIGILTLIIVVRYVRAMRRSG